MKQTIRLIGALMLLLSGVAAQAVSVTLYDDGLGSLPGAQPWLFFAANGVSTQTLVAGEGVQFTTTSSVAGGYSNTIPIINAHKNVAFPLLDRSTGFRLDFELTVLTESHSSADRAGFSVILLGSDGLGVELGFWSDEIWAQTATPLFNHGEAAAFDTTAGEVEYALEIVNSSYTLAAGTTELLSGSVKDYSAFGVPYSLNNYLFLGDDTGSAAASVVLGDVSISTLTAVPLPAPLLLLAPGLLMVRRLAYAPTF